MGHVFSVEMKSKMRVRSISISNEAQDRVLFEGDLGQLEEVAFIGGGLLEVKGAYVVLRVELGHEEMERLMSQVNDVCA